MGDYLNIILLLVSLGISLLASFYIKIQYSKYQKIVSKRRISGFEAARKILDTNELQSVHIVETRGELSDHYDPKRKVVRLSSHNYHQQTISALAVAAHEVGHAIQDKENFLFLKIRSWLVPIVNIFSKLGYVAIMIGLIAEQFNLALGGVILISGILLFQLITLPVEFNASKRALFQLKSVCNLDETETKQAKMMLNAAALTYVAGTLTSLLEIFRLLLIINSRNRD